LKPQIPTRKINPYKPPNMPPVPVKTKGMKQKEKEKGTGTWQETKEEKERPSLSTAKKEPAYLQFF
jgi:hypothetical protein